MLQSGPRASDIDEALLNSAAQLGANGSIGYQVNRTTQQIFDGVLAPSATSGTTRSGFGFVVVRERWGSGVGWSVCGRSYQAGVVSITSML